MSNTDPPEATPIDITERSVSYDSHQDRQPNDQNGQHNHQDNSTKELNEDAFSPRTHPTAPADRPADNLEDVAETTARLYSLMLKVRADEERFRNFLELRRLRRQMPFHF